MTHALRAPVALSCGEPSGIGPEIALKAWQAIGHEVPFFWIGDPAHLPAGAEWHAISAPDQVMASQQTTMPVLEHRFAASAPAGVPAPENAQSVIDVIARGVDLVQSGQAAALCTAPIHKKALKHIWHFTIDSNPTALSFTMISTWKQKPLDVSWSFLMIVLRIQNQFC